MLVTIVLILYLLVFVLDFMPERKRNSTRVNIFYGAALSVSFCVLILYWLDITVPGPTAPIKLVVEKMLQLWSK